MQQPPSPRHRSADWPGVSQGNHYDGTTIPDHDTRPDFAPPKASWDPAISPASRIIYKGDLFPGWKGNVLISGLGALGLVRVEISGEDAREAQRIPMSRRMRCVREGPDGTLWMLEDGAGGRLLKDTPAWEPLMVEDGGGIVYVSESARASDERSSVRNTTNNMCFHSHINLSLPP